MLAQFINAFELKPRLALIATTSVCLASIAAFALHLGAPWWAAISAWIVAHADHQRWWGKSIQRVLASFAGSFGGYQLMVMLQSDPFLQFLCIFCLTVLGLYKALTSPEHSYAWLLGTVTAVIVITSGINNIENLQNIAVERAFEVSVGVSIAGMVTGLFRLDPGAPAPKAVPLKPAADTPDSALDRQTYFWIVAIGGGLGLAFVPVVSQAFQIPGMNQIAITIAVCLYTGKSQIAHAGYKRIAGCFIGGVVAIGFLAFNVESLFVLEVMTFAFMFIASGLHYGDPRWSAIGTQAGVAFLVCMMSSIGPVESIVPVIHRFVGMMTALVGIVFFTMILEWFYLNLATERKMPSI